MFHPAPHTEVPPSTLGSMGPLAKKRSSGQLLMGFRKGLGLRRMGSVMRRGETEEAAGPGSTMKSTTGSVGGPSRSRRKGKPKATPLPEGHEEGGETDAKGDAQIGGWESIPRPTLEKDNGDEGISRPFNVEHELHVSPDLAGLPPAWLLSLRDQGLSEQDLLLVTAARQRQHAASGRAVPLRAGGCDDDARGPGGDGKPAYTRAPLSAPAGRLLDPPSAPGDGHSQRGGMLRKFSFELGAVNFDSGPKKADAFASSPISSSPRPIDSSWGKGAGKAKARDVFGTHFNPKAHSQPPLDSYPVSAGESSDPEHEAETDSSARSASPPAVGYTSSSRRSPPAPSRKSKRLSDQLRGFKELNFGLGLGEEEEWGKSILGAAWDMGAGLRGLSECPTGGSGMDTSSGAGDFSRRVGRTGGLGSITEGGTSLDIPALPSPISPTAPTASSPQTPRPLMPPPPVHSPPPTPTPAHHTPERRVLPPLRRPGPLLPPADHEGAGGGAGADDRSPRSLPPPARPKRPHSSHSQSPPQSISCPEHHHHHHCQHRPHPDSTTNKCPSTDRGTDTGMGTGGRPIPTLRESSESFGVHCTAPHSAGSSVDLDGELATPFPSAEACGVREVRAVRDVELGGGSSDEAGSIERMLGEGEGDREKNYAYSGYDIDLRGGGEYSGEEEGGKEGRRRGRGQGQLGDEASGDEASGDEASGDEASGSDMEDGFARCLAGRGKAVDRLGGLNGLGGVGRVGGRVEMGYPPSPPQTAASGLSAHAVDGREDAKREKDKAKTGVYPERLALGHSPSLPEIGMSSLQIHHGSFGALSSTSDPALPGAGVGTDAGADIGNMEPQETRDSPQISLPESAAPTTPSSQCSPPASHFTSSHPPLPIHPRRLSPQPHPLLSLQTSYSTIDSAPYHPDPDDPLAGLDTAGREERASIALSLLSNRTSNSMHSLSELREATVRIAYKGLMGGAAPGLEQGQGQGGRGEEGLHHSPSVPSPGYSPSYLSHRFFHLHSPVAGSPLHVTGTRLEQGAVEDLLLEHEHEGRDGDTDPDPDATMGGTSIGVPSSAAGDESEEGGMSVFEYGTTEEGARDALDALGEAAARIAWARGRG